MCVSCGCNQSNSKPTPNAITSDQLTAASTEAGVTTSLVGRRIADWLGVTAGFEAEVLKALADADVAVVGKVFSK